jgi:lipoprotein-anchoring transpeptidase ErfK/SrfK
VFAFPFSRATQKVHSGIPMAGRTIRISLSDQRLDLLEGGERIATFAVSTARNGPGEREGSECTPRGAHEIEAKIGAGMPEGTVFVGREPTGERCTAERFQAEPGRDWILTRILWLGGVEPGRNQGGDVDTRSRYIYIHGCPDALPVGTPGSHGCVRMRNDDVCRLFDMVEVGTRVDIDE